MRNRIITLVVLMLGITVQAQDKWRTLTLTSTTYGDYTSEAVINSFSAGLDYELGNKWWISSWNQYQVNTKNGSSWFATSSTIDKRYDNGFTIGAGFLHFQGNDNFGAFPTPVQKQSAVALKLSYRIKL